MNFLNLRTYFITLTIAALCVVVVQSRDILVYVLLLSLANLLGLWILSRMYLIMAYLFLFIGAVAAEVMMIYQGTWEYTMVHVVGYPFWLPFLWFSAIVFLGTMIELLRKKTLSRVKK